MCATRERLAAVEIAVAAGAAALAVAIVLSRGAAAWDYFVVPMALAGLGAWIAVEDLRTLTIPDGAVLALALLGAALRVQATAGEPATTTAFTLVVDLAMSGGMLWLVREINYRRRGNDVLGFGDVKLGAACGLLLGTAGFSIALLAASLTGLLVALGAAVRHGAVDRSAKLPFGALLAPAALLVWWIAGPAPALFD